MAIRIPSKNIYSISNPKVRDNAIDNISVKYNQIENKNEYNVLVQMDKQQVESLQYEDTQKDDVFVPYGLGGYFYNFGISYIVLEKGYATIKSLIPIEQNNSFIETLLTGKNGEGNPYINYRIIGQKINGQADCTAQRRGTTAGNYVTYGEIEHHSRTFGEQGVITLPSDQEEIAYEVVVQGENSSQSGTAKIIPTYQNSTLTTATASVVQIDDIDYYEITINYPAWVRVTKLKGVQEELNSQVTTDIPLSGEFVEYDPQYLEISFYGNTVGININQGVELFGDENGKTPFTIDSNELMQGRANTAKYMVTLNEYNKGKETAVIRCNIDDYYDYYDYEYDNEYKEISANGHNLLNTANYDALYNATYSNGEVMQVRPDMGYSAVDYSPICSFTAGDENFTSDDWYFHQFDSTIFDDLSHGDMVEINYKLYGISRRKRAYVVQDAGGDRYLSIEKPIDENKHYSSAMEIVDNLFLTVALNFDVNGGIKTHGCVLLRGEGDYVPWEEDIPPFELTSIFFAEYLFQLQGYDGNNVVHDTLHSLWVEGNSADRAIFPFQKDNTFSHIRFKLNGKETDTAILYDVSNLENGKTYCFSAELITGSGQGGIYWQNMQINRGNRAKKYEKYLPMLFQQYDEVIPMKYTISGEDEPLSTYTDGSPKVFKVLESKLYSKGQVFQELYLQEK